MIAMRYKMLVLDLDDTLLRDDYTISERNRMRLIEAQQMGVKVVLASGRPTPAMLQYVEILQLDQFESYLISFNGAVVTDIAGGGILFDKSLSRSEVLSLYDFSVENDLHIITYSDRGVISETDSPYIDIEIKLTGMAHCKVESFQQEIGESAVKCILLGEPSYLVAMEQKLKSQYPHLSISRSKPFFLEVMPNGVDKAASLHFIADRLGIQSNEVIAVGNAGNDLSMIEYAGLGVWVDNVPSELRSKADLIVSSNMEDGVAEVVEKYVIHL